MISTSYRYIIVTILVLPLLLISASATAEDLPMDTDVMKVHLGGFSRHWPRIEGRRDWMCETNPGFGLELAQDHSGGVFYSAAGYRDSYCYDAVMITAGQRWNITQMGPVDISAGYMVGTSKRTVRMDIDDATGTATYDRGWIPVILPLVTARLGAIEANISGAPRIDHVLEDGPVLMVDFAVRF